MKYILVLFLLITNCFAFFEDINSFKADFTQTVTDEKNKVLTYKGNLVASKPQNAMWDYKTPITKTVYINNNSVTIVEPEIEQVIIRKIESNFDFFKMLKNAKMLKKNIYLAEFEKTSFIIVTKKDKIKSISYIDEFENTVKVSFTNQQRNVKIDKTIFIPKFSLDFDVITD